MDRPRCRPEPLAEEVSIERIQREPFRPAGRRRNRAHVLRLQSVLAQGLKGARAGVDAEGFHASHCKGAGRARSAQRFVCSLANASAIAEPPACGAAARLG